MTTTSSINDASQPVGSSSSQREGHCASHTTGANAAAAPTDGRAEDQLPLLALNTTPRRAGEAIKTLSLRAMEDDRDAKRAGEFLLSLWDSARWPLDLEDTSFFEHELSFAARHLINFILTCRVTLKQMVTYREIEPIIAAWGQGES